MSMDLYFGSYSPPSHAVWFVAKELGIELNLKHIDLMKGEHLAPEFVKINPQHAIPTLVDHEKNGLVLSESRAILTYLINKTSLGHKLYPSDAVERALVDRMLYFEAGTLMPAQVTAFYGVFVGAGIQKDKIPVYEEKLAILNTFLEGKKYLAGGTHRTIADISMVTTLAMASVFKEVDLTKYPNIDSWYKGIRAEIPYNDKLQELIDANSRLVNK